MAETPLLNFDLVEELHGSPQALSNWVRHLARNLVQG